MNIDISKGSPDRFGYEWDTYDTVDENYEEQFLRWTTGIDKSAWKGMSVLDVGCGMGRNSLWPQKYEASETMSIDVDTRSLAAARRTLEKFETATVQQMSAYEIDFKDRFDIVFSIGVIHHLEFPEKALAQLYKATKPGGKMLFWVYGRENNGWLLWILNPTRKIIFSRLPISWVKRLSVIPTAALWMALRMGLSRLEYFRLIKTFKFWHLQSIVFDQMLPQIANYWRKDEVKALAENAGLTNVELHWINEMSWTAVGEKPS